MNNLHKFRIGPAYVVWTWGPEWFWSRVPHNHKIVNAPIGIYCRRCWMVLDVDPQGVKYE